MTETHQAFRAFGARVRRLRIEAGHTQEELDHLAGVHRTEIGYIERAERDVRLGRVWQLADALGVDAGRTLPRPEDPDEASGQGG